MLIILALFVSFFSAGLGVGGGAILVPSLMSICKFDFRRSASTSLATIISISLIGAICHCLMIENMEEMLAIANHFYFIPACMAGALIGGKFVQKIKVRWLKLFFATFLLIVSLKMFRAFYLSNFIFESLNNLFLLSNPVLVVVFGIVTGIASTLLGVGCGLIIVPFFVLIVGLEIHHAITLSLITMFFLTSTATFVYKKHKLLDTKSLKKMIIPTFIGAISGGTNSYVFSVKKCAILEKILYTKNILENYAGRKK